VKTKIASLPFVFLFFISLVSASNLPNSQIDITYALEGEVTINIYTDYYYPPQFWVVKVDNEEIDRFTSTETYHTYTFNLSSGEHWVEVWLDGPTWHGLVTKQKIVVLAKDYYTKQEVIDLIEDYLTDYYTSDEVDDLINDLSQNLQDNYYDKEAINNFLKDLENKINSVNQTLENTKNEILTQLTNYALKSDVEEVKSYISQQEPKWLEKTQDTDTWRPLDQILNFILSKVEQIYQAMKSFIFKDFISRIEYDNRIRDLNQRIFALEQAIKRINETAYLQGKLDACIQFKCRKIDYKNSTFWRTKDNKFLIISPLW
jgi:hypothetical protein